MRIFFLLSFCVIFTSATFAADADRGKLLYKNQCIHCHTSIVHIRSNRKAGDIAGIRYQVSRWVANNKIKWTRVDIDDVVAYLNKVYYKHKN